MAKPLFSIVTIFAETYHIVGNTGGSIELLPSMNCIVGSQKQFSRVLQSDPSRARHYRSGYGIRRLLWRTQILRSGRRTRL